jgi:arginyl-tRNA synthetase
VTPAELSRAVLSTVRRAVEADELTLGAPLPERITVRRPPHPARADYATNVALQLAGVAGRSPLHIAEILLPRLAAAPGIARVEIADPGFLNITLDVVSHAELVWRVRRHGVSYGHTLTGLAVTLVHDGEPRAAAVADAGNRMLRVCGAVDGPPELVVARRPVDVGMQELVRALGFDGARWALLRPPPEDACELDPAVHLVQRSGNPLFRVRYAYARSRALLRGGRELGVEPGEDGYRHPSETELLGLVADHPRVVESAARYRAPDRVARHLVRMADAFLRFQYECPALPKGDEKPSAAHGARLALADAAGAVLAGGLSLLGISAPEHL